MPAKFLIEPSILGQDILDVPAFSFLVENHEAGKKIMFDLGIMKAWETKLGPKSEMSCLFPTGIPDRLSKRD